MNFQDLEFQPDDLGGVYAQVSYPNGYGASVVRNPMSYGHERGLYELAVLRGDSICHDTPVTSDVEGWLSPADVDRLLEQIEQLPPVG